MSRKNKKTLKRKHRKNTKKGTKSVRKMKGGEWQETGSCSNSEIAINAPAYTNYNVQERKNAIAYYIMNDKCIGQRTFTGDGALGNGKIYINSNNYSEISSFLGNKPQYTDKIYKTSHLTDYYTDAEIKTVIKVDNNGKLIYTNQAQKYR